MTKNRPSGVKWAANALQELERVMQLRSLSLVRREGSPGCFNALGGCGKGAVRVP